MSKKENLNIDEFYTYGLANSQFQLVIDNYKIYNGHDILQNYMMPNNTNLFNIQNVYFNQSMDTHPFLYYFIVNFICSIFNNDFNMWYGLIINIFFMVLIFFEIQYLTNIFTNDKIFSYLFSLSTFFCYGIINMFSFTRMYVMLSAFSLFFIILSINFINNNFKNKKKFYILFFINVFCGVLTHYHFIVIGLLSSITIFIMLIKQKRYKDLIYIFISGMLGLVSSFLIYPPMIKQIFGDSSMHSLNYTGREPLYKNLIDLFANIKNGFFMSNISFTIYIVLIIVFIISIILKQIKKNHITINFKIKLLYLILFSISIIYILFISATGTFMYERYLYNIYPIVFLILFLPIYYLFNNFNKYTKYICIVLIFIFSILSWTTKKPTALNIGDESFHTYLTENKNTRCLLLYKTVDENGNSNSMTGTSLWKLPYPIYLLRDMDDIVFIDTSKKNVLTKSNSILLENNDALFVFIYTTQNDEELINELIERDNFYISKLIYKTNFIHVYELHK